MKRFAKVGMAKIEISTEDGGGEGGRGRTADEGICKGKFCKGRDRKGS